VKPRESDAPGRVHFAASGGIDTSAFLSPRDPFEAFDELMELVEGLLPGPPPQRPLGPYGPLRL
jgi:hypothetical protein